jgi:CheY-like chemotaxis protein
VTPAVLVVDDHPAALAGLAHPLRERFQVLVASTVAEALVVLRRVAVAGSAASATVDIGPVRAINTGSPS